MGKRITNVEFAVLAHADKLAELEEKLDEHIEAMLELRLNHRMIHLEERLDKLEKSKRRAPLLQSDIMKIGEYVKPLIDELVKEAQSIRHILSRIR